MSTDTAALRAELKAFERDFRAKNGCDPSVEDIKKAGLAGRYKLYKALLKGEKSSSSSSFAFPSLVRPPARPSTPPRMPPHQSTSIIPKSRAVKTQIVSSSNPFSPVKDKGKQKQLSPFSDRLPNPLTSPAKAKSTRQTLRPLTPDPFPPVEQDRLAHRSQHNLGPSNPVSRARNASALQLFCPFQNFRRSLRPIAMTMMVESFLNMRTRLFVADSPVKAAPKSGTFKLLFEEDEALQPSDSSKAKRRLTRSKTASASNTLFGPRSQRARSMSRSSGDELYHNHDRLPEMKPAGEEKDGVITQRKAKKGKQMRVHGLSFGKNNLFASVDVSERLPQHSKPVLPSHGEPDNSANIRTSAKRPLTDTVEPEPDQFTPLPSNSQIPLLPPSPPAAHATSWNGRSKRKTAGRKKPKLAKEIHEDEDENEDSSDESHIKVREWSRQRRAEGDADDQDSDLLLGLHAQGASRKIPTQILASDDDAGEFEVHLPDDLRRMLAISPSKARNLNEEGVVRGLLYGARTSHYDGAKGGDIWDAGEIGEGTGGEEDWEGEPVAWEVGEL
ncbi:hypothetical protein EW146_g7878 [Bondarzewia mesenterica]|uniref:DNA replication regulator SLD2 n=1 Tax=Bondarzewia mesenterica TaxID=1095465 RepID=A0A4S4LIV7_9AGAM|nr:hypothetical protein EW146_g7878 [Bondarzewia mesenterica]